VKRTSLSARIITVFNKYIFKIFFIFLVRCIAMHGNFSVFRGLQCVRLPLVCYIKMKF